MEASHYINYDTRASPGDNELVANNPGAIKELVGKSMKMKGSRRQWTDHENAVFIDILLELVAEGLKTDNSFKKARIPGCNITQDNVKNKLLVWRRDFGKIYQISTFSGFGWSDKNNTVEVTDDVWDHYVKANRGVEKYRSKVYPYYRQWIIIFGVDRATGETSKDPDESFDMMDKIREATSKKRKNDDYCFPANGEGSGTSSHTTEEIGTPDLPFPTDPAIDLLAKKGKSFVLTPRTHGKHEAPTNVFQTLVADFITKTNSSLEEGFGKMAEAARQVVTLKEPTKAETVIK